MNTLTKQPYEALNVWVDFAAMLGLADTITIDSVKAMDLATGLDSTATVIEDSPAPVVSGQKVLFQIIGGVNGDSHKITVKVLTSAGEKVEEDIDLYVVEK